MTEIPADVVNWRILALFYGYWIELAVFEKTLLALDPISRIVPTTRTRITASITAYSAMSCPSSADQSLRTNSDIFSSSSTIQFKMGEMWGKEVQLMPTIMP